AVGPYVCDPPVAKLDLEPLYQTAAQRQRLRGAHTALGARPVRAREALLGGQVGDVGVTGRRGLTAGEPPGALDQAHLQLRARPAVAQGVEAAVGALPRARPEPRAPRLPRRHRVLGVEPQDVGERGP